MAKISLTAMLLLSIAVANLALASPYLGAKQCLTCHPVQYAQWARTPHARTHERLTLAQRRDPRCGSCHNTSTADGILGVQCESCHGPGRDYWPADVMKSRKRARTAGLWDAAQSKVCENCHTNDSTRIHPFNFEHALIKVRHRATDSTGEKP